ncbi:PTS mannose transporter subunit IIA, partial [Proteus mirabilis]
MIVNAAFEREGCSTSELVLTLREIGQESIQDIREQLAQIDSNDADEEDGL